MKIFISIPWFHPAYKAGGPVQSVANMVDQLGNRQWAISNGTPKVISSDKELFEFKIFCGNKDLDGSMLANVEFDKWVRYADNTGVWYASANNLLPVLQKEIKKDAPAYLFIMGIYSWRFNLKPLLFCKGVKKIISVRGMLHPGALSQKSFKKKIYLSLWKLLGLHKKNIFHATDEKERGYIQSSFAKATADKAKVRIVVAANFPRVLSQQPVAEKKEGCLKLVSIALISPMKNISLVLDALGLASGKWGVASGESGLPAEASAKEGVVSQESEVGNGKWEVASGKREENSIEYNIYGPVKDKRYWEQCEAVIKKMPPNITVNYHGDIHPDDIANALTQNHVFILPSKSENFGHAIYEALIAGRPVITSNHTPWNDLEKFSAGINVSTDNSAELQKAIEHFAVMKQEQLTEWSNGARKYALQAVDLEETRKQYEEMFGEKSR